MNREPGAGRARVLRLGACLGALASLAGCGSAAVPAGSRPDLEWPVDSPRVRLERVIEVERQSSMRRFLSRVAGRSHPQLFQRPFAVAWDDQDLLVADPGAGRVVRIDPRGRITAKSSLPLESPVGIAACDIGVLVSDSATGRIWLLDQRLSGARLVKEGLERPTGIACSGSEVFVSETAGHRLLMLEIDGGGREVGERWVGRRGERPCEFNFPSALALAGGSLWVGDTMNFRVQELDPESGDCLGQFGRLGDAAGDMPRLKGLVVDSSGHLWISDAHLDRVWLYRADGTFLLDLGRSGSGRGEFSFPAGLAAADGRVAVVDSFNRRVQVFRELSGDLPRLDLDKGAGR